MNAETPTASFENLSDRNLAKLNELLPWKCFTQDAQGRRLGQQAWNGKRSEPQAIPDPRIVALASEVDLSDSTVLELGCFEGVHTIGLCHFSSHVFGVDSRVENVAKTLVRCAAHGFFPRIFSFDLEDIEATGQLPEFDVLHHVGVLYHLSRPAAHLKAILPRIKRAVLLDTHYATESDPLLQGEFGLEYKVYKEFGVDEVFSGMKSTSLWMLKKDLLETLSSNGFNRIRVIQDQIQRNGPRLTLLAMR